MGKRNGALVVGQSGGCTQVINASLMGVALEAMSSRGFREVWGMRHGVEGLLRDDLMDLRSESRAAWRRIGRAPAAALGSCRRKLTGADVEKVVGILKERGARAFIYIGGNDSADTSHRISRAAAKAGLNLAVIGVPKTIDNDLPEMDHCPGYGSAARFVASVVADTGMETEAMRTIDPVKIIEVMGRHAGWLAAASALAKRSDLDAPHVVWPPEVPFDEGRFLALVRASLDRVGYCVAVVCETICGTDGRLVGSPNRKIERDPFGHVRALDVAEHLCGLVQDRLGIRARWDKPGTIQRMSSAHISETDLREAERCGRHAVRLALAGATDRMVAMRRKRGARYVIEFDSVPLERIANRERLLPARFFDRERMMPTEAFRRYALPLVGPGLPQHPRLGASDLMSFARHARREER